MKNIFAFVFIVFSAIALYSCTKDNIEEVVQPIPYQKIGEGYAIGAATKVELYANQALTTGYNAFYIALYDSVSGKSIEQAQITLMPMMDMGTMKHSSPVEHPSPVAKNKLFSGAAVFTMPSGSMGSWTLDVNVALSGKQGKCMLPINIAAAQVSRLKSFVSKADNGKYFVALLQPGLPKVGVNEVELAIYKMKNMMAFPADSSLSITMIPEMPTMGHGSPNNIDPVHIGNGHYKGKVNFTMTGLWYINLDFKAGTAVADTTTLFEVNF